MKSIELINLNEAKHALRVSGSYDDDLILGLLEQAYVFAQKYIGRGFEGMPSSALKPSVLLHVSYMYEGKDGVPRAALEVYNQYKIIKV